VQRDLDAKILCSCCRKIIDRFRTIREQDGVMKVHSYGKGGYSQVESCQYSLFKKIDETRYINRVQAYKNEMSCYVIS
jgi:hypothetical protein